MRKNTKWCRKNTRNRLGARKPCCPRAEELTGCSKWSQKEFGIGIGKCIGTGGENHKHSTLLMGLVQRRKPERHCLQSRVGNLSL